MSDITNSKVQGLPQTPYMNALYQGPQMNTKHNIIAGPQPGEYWNHSPGLERPIIREEGPFPVQGNVGSLVASEGRGNFNECGHGLPNISGSPNCTSPSAFKSDMYTRADTCGAECTLSYPEAFGGKSFGMSGGDVITNAHALHAYKNERAATEGRGPSQTYGCYEWVPKLGKTNGNSCMLDQYPEFQQVGDWQKLSENKGIVNYTFKQ